MAEYRDAPDRVPNGVYVEKKSKTGAIVGTIVIVALVVVGLLFATGFWSADVKSGELPKVNINAKGGDLPEIQVHSKELVVGSSKTTVTVPKVKTEKTVVDVPVVGVKDGDK